MKKRVLLIDDSPLVLELVRESLEALGIEMAAAKDLADLEKRLVEERPDLILMDVQMPEVFGDDIAYVLRAGRGVKVPIFLFSNLDDAELAERAAAAEIEGYVSKRLGVDELVRRLQQILKDHSPSKARARERFLPMFLEAANARVARSLALIAKSNATATFAELHALAGEAAILGLTSVAQAAREGELAAKRWREGDDPADRAACEKHVRALETALASIPRA